LISAIASGSFSGAEAQHRRRDGRVGRRDGVAAAVRANAVLMSL
jgi:hypothetical protein